MAGFRVEFSFLQDDATYSEFVDVTDDVIASGFSPIKRVLNSNEYDTGSLKFDNFKLTLRNETARYSDAINVKSIFPIKRDETIVKIIWSRNEEGIDCGNFFCGLAWLDPEIRVFKGLIEDNSTKFDTLNQTIVFNILGVESIIQKAETPYSSLSVGNTAEQLIFTCLNQTKITQFFNVSSLNITVNENFTVDSITSLEDTSVLEVLEEVLFLSGGVLIVEDDTVHVRSRTVDPTSSHTFYSPSSDLGIEDIINISAYTTGLNRTFNFWKWKGTSVKHSFVDSIERYGLRKKEIESELITNPTTQSNILLALITEFGFPKIEFDLTAPLYTSTVGISFLNKVNVDYPADYLPKGDSEASRYNRDRYGQARYARQISSLFIAITDEWKILNKTIDQKKSTVTFRLRGV